MLVLSACDTVKGAHQGGEGLIGLTWAAFVAGVSTQVVSQWSVEDAATSRLMGDFYGGLKQGKSKSVALQKAALTLMRDGKHQHPFYWASFLLHGRPALIPPPNEKGAFENATLSPVEQISRALLDKPQYLEKGRSRLH